MFKRLSVALAALFVLASSAFGAGTLPGFSLSQQMGKDGKPLAGCKLNIYQAASTATPQIAYQDSSLTIPVSGGSILTCDAFGRLPQFFLADGSIKIALFDKNGVTQVTADGLLVVGPSSGGGGGSPVDPTTILATGDIKVNYGTGILSGFVRANGRTIGSATSGGTERANADCQALFLFLYADPNLAVSGGRGVSAAADWAANKTIALPDWRGRTIAGLSDMGNTDSGRVSTTYFGCTGLVLGCAGGAENTTLTAAQIPSITSNNAAQSITVTTVNGHTLYGDGGMVSDIATGGAGQKPASGGFSSSWSISANNAISVTSNNTSGTAHRTVQPTMLATIYIKL
jgi:microcystin-dependent protein